MTNDPGAMWRQMLADWERISNEYGGKLMSSGEFSQGMNAATAAGLKMQQALHEQMTRFLAAANMPSREEVAGLGESLRRIEERLGRIEQKLGSAPEPRAAPRPPRTRKPAA